MCFSVKFFDSKAINNVELVGFRSKIEIIPMLKVNKYLKIYNFKETKNLY